MAEKLMSWEEKQEKGLPLNPLEQTKADATRLTLRRIRDQEEERKFQAEKSEAPRIAPVVVSAPELPKEK